MASAKSRKPQKRDRINSRQHAFVKAHASGKSIHDAAIIAGYSKKNPDQSAKETKFFEEGKKRINVAALGIRHTALDTAFKLRGGCAPRDPKEAAQFGIKVVVVDIPRPPPNAIDVLM